MKTSSRPLLLADALINLVLGGLLPPYPRGLVQVLGLPEVRSDFSIVCGVGGPEMVRSSP